MADNNFWAKITSKLFFLTAIVALAIVGYGVVKSAVRRAEIDQEIKNLQADIAEHKAKSDQLTNLITYLNSAEYKEKEARLELGLQKPGENVVIITNLPSTAPSATADNQTAEPNWLRWLKYFLGNK